MKQLINFLFIIFIFVSCSSNPNLEGLWYIDSETDENGNIIENSREQVFFAFEDNDSVVILRDPISSIYSFDTTNFSISDSTFIIGNSWYSFRYNVDSLILVSRDMPTVQIVLRRINENRKTDKIDENYFSGLFSFGPADIESYQKVNFLPDSIFQHSRGFCSGYPFGRWSILTYKGFSFLDFHGVFPLIMINSASDLEIILSSPTDKDDLYLLKKINSKINRQDLIGEWIGQCDSLSSKLDSLGINNYNEFRLIVTNDFLQLEPFGEKRKWTLGFEREHIYFPENWPDFEWNLICLTENQLQIGVYDTVNYDENVLSFTRKKRITLGVK